MKDNKLSESCEQEDDKKVLRNESSCKENGFGGSPKWCFSRYTAIEFLVVLLAINMLIAVGALSFHRDFSPIVDIIALALIVLLVYFYFFSSDFVIKSHIRVRKKEECHFLSKETCPYPSKTSCPYDTNHCSVYPGRKTAPWKKKILMGVFITAIFVYVLLHLKGGSSCEKFKEIALPICSSVIVASILAYLVDMPGRIREYQNYFVDLLASNEYLKQMSEDDLVSLKKRITRVQNSKDVPRMPKGLIKFDDNVCDLLRSPFYKEYSQASRVARAKDFEGNYVCKSISIDAVAFNPYGHSKSIAMDIGFRHSLFVENEQDWEHINEKIGKLFKINSFTISFGEEVQKRYDLLPYIRIVYREACRAGSDYNCLIYVMLDTEKIKCLCKESISNHMKPESTGYQLNYSSIIENDNLVVYFEDKIRYHIDYEIVVPETDIVYTKSLRHPVQYFNLDYSLDADLDGYTLIGQLIGSMLEYPNSSVLLSQDRKRLVFKTTSWLLPRNGAVVIHNKG